MAPVKFGDIHKVANEVLSDDYQTSGYQFKAKQKTSFQGAVISTDVDLFPAKDSCCTPAKLSWKLPTPLGLSYFCVDKLELDKGGKTKLEMSTEKAYPGLKIECRSDLVDVSKIVACCTYTGLKDTQLKLETTPMKQDFTAEVTYSMGMATCGAKCTPDTLTCPELGVRFLKGPYFCSLLAKEKFSTCTAHCFYKVSNDIKCAATFDYGGKKSGNFAVGGSYQALAGTLLKAKVLQDQSVHCTVKHTLSKGVFCTAGAKYDIKKGDLSYGLQLRIE
jgi:hypothetical protein